MKKTVVFMMVILLLLCSSCSEQNQKAQDMGKNVEAEALSFPYAEYIGHGRQEAFEALKGEGEFQESNLKGVYFLDHPVSILGRDVEVALEAGDYEEFTDTIYRTGYRLVIQNPAQEDFKWIKKIEEALTEKYGEKTTYPGLANTLSAVDSLEKLKELQQVSDTWAFSDDPVLEVDFETAYITNTDGAEVMTILVACQVSTTYLRNGGQEQVRAFYEKAQNAQE
ncbi:hypothetical protein [Ructibacterium gallinarum]|uniref:Lipoprotein n=1 Tax=Ructibacterium gallinarum TaxID=2779355 RepID=A0A9D5R781_9FIRM|nr:hypothetical protein [Ructibacterium gallinarum]MBE5038861.1 hypothetical protein [Ructibacterium gallinarum]